MLSEVEKRICKRVSTLEEELAEVTSKLVSINTSDPPGDNYVACADFLTDYLKSIGANVRIEQVPIESLPRHPETGKPLSRPNVVGEIAGSGNGHILHFNGHYDIVPAVGEWNSDPFHPVIKGGKLYGRGSTDMKGGIAAAMVAAKALKLEEVNLPGTVSFSFVPDEEYGGPTGTRFLLGQKKVKADYCIVAEPTGGDDFYNGHKGSLWMEITTYGKAAHGARPWKGINAFENMVEVVQEINAKLKPKLLSGGDIEIDNQTAGRKGAITLGGRVTTGESLNVVPAQCTMTIDRRIAPGEEVNEVIGEFSNILESLKQREPQFRGKLNVLFGYNACVVPTDSYLMNTFKELLISVINQEPKITIMAGACEMRHFQSVGIPTLIYGPGNPSMAHQSDEYVEVSKLVTAAQVYALAAMRLCLPIFT